MTGNTITEFMNDLLSMGGPEKEFTHNNKRYFLESCYHEDKEMIELYIFEIKGNNREKFSFWGKSFQECVEQFEQAPIFDGKNIYDVEKDITVLYG